MYEPKLAELIVVQSRLSPAVWEARERAAREAEDKMLAIQAKMEGEGKSFSHAMDEVLPLSKRSWAMRMWKRWKNHGLDGLFDLRKPLPPQMPKVCQDLLTGARLGNPQLTVEEALQVLKAGGIRQLPSVSMVTRLLRNADARRRYHEKTSQPEESARQETPQAEREEVEELELAGAELLKAADLETGTIAALTTEVVEIGKQLKAKSGSKEATGDSALRDQGKFTASYNQARTRKDGEATASYLRPAEEKGKSKVAADFCFVSQTKEVVERKLAALVYEALVNPGRGWDGLRSVSGQNLKSLVGYAYMPATLQKQASELSQLGAGKKLLRRVGVHWHAVATKRWGEPGGIAALYVDNHVKEVWSNLFTKAGKVSHRSRVMPCITTTYVQTGAGTPVVVLAQSGSAPLAPRLSELVEEAESRLEQDVRRAVVIDAEGSTFDILESFDKQQRVIVTPCKPSRFQELELRYTRGSYYRPYREHDEIRVATATLHHKSTKRELELGAILIRRQRRESPFVLLTTGLKQGFTGTGLADLYFERWPLQENFFKNGVPLGLNRHRGNCGQLVTNIAVATELEQLEVRLVKTEEKLGRLNANEKKLCCGVEEADKAHSQAANERDHHRQEVDRLIANGETNSKAFATASLAHHTAMATVESTQPALDKAKAALERHEMQRQDTQDAIEKMIDRVAELEPMRMIRQLDVALDSILTAMKLTLAMLIIYAFREYIPSTDISTETFLNRLLSIRGRRETTKTLERIIFYENPRDPRITAALVEACEVLNQRGLERDDRALRFELERSPP